MGITYEVDGRRGHAVVWLPEGYDEGQRWPLIVFLHAYEERGERDEHLTVGLAPVLEEQPDLYSAIVLFPQCPQECVWAVYERSWADGMAPALGHAEAALSMARERFSVDESRIALTGASMGGYGTFAWAAQDPTRFAAVGPVCGGGHVEDAPSLAAQRLWIWHGVADDVVSVEESRRMVAAIRTAGGNPRFSEPAGDGHAVWDRAYRDPEFAAFLCGRPA